MNWFNFRGVSINMSRFVFYDKSADGTAGLCTPRGHVCFLSGDHRKAVDLLMSGNPDPPRHIRHIRHTVPGLAWPDGRTPWVLVSGGAINMAMADMIDTNEEGRIAVHGGVYTRLYTGEDCKRIRNWLYRNGRPRQA